MSSGFYSPAINIPQIPRKKQSYLKYSYRYLHQTVMLPKTDENNPSSVTQRQNWTQKESHIIVYLLNYGMTFVVFKNYKIVKHVKEPEYIHMHVHVYMHVYIYLCDVAFSKTLKLHTNLSLFWCSRVSVNESCGPLSAMVLGHRLWRNIGQEV